VIFIASCSFLPGGNAYFGGSIAILARSAIAGGME
jgi:hypothetical protein